jgi:peptidoglycan/LPS O-acetylase OafA/YrhL
MSDQGGPIEAPALPARVTPEHIPMLDGLRGAAACIVVIGHATTLSYLSGPLGSGLGPEGVMLFFLLSGFLMAHLYLGQPFSRAAAASYARHRIGRVVPLFVAVVLVSFAIVSIWGAAWWAYQIRVPQLLENLAFLRGGSALWSVPVEVQFYAIFAGLWWLRTRGRLILGLVVVQVVAFAGMAVLTAIQRLSGHMLVDTLPFWCQFFLVGIVVAMLRGGRPKLLAVFARPVPRVLAGWAAVVLFVFTVPGLRRFEGLPMSLASIDPIGGLAALLLFLAALAGLGPLRLLSTRPFRWLGGVSYGVYLFHMPVLVALAAMAPPRRGLHGLAELLIAFVIILVAAWASNRAFEAPVRRLIANATWAPPWAVARRRPAM